jgi:hypothetical protein
MIRQFQERMPYGLFVPDIRYGSWSRLKRAEPLAHRCVAKAKPSVASNETIVGHIGRNPIMKAWSIISLLFAAAILATIPISPQVTPRGLELRVDEAGAVTYGRYRRVHRRAYRRAYRSGYYSGAPSYYYGAPSYYGARSYYGYGAPSYYGGPSFYIGFGRGWY